MALPGFDAPGGSCGARRSAIEDFANNRYRPSAHRCGYRAQRQYRGVAGHRAYRIGAPIHGDAVSHLRSIYISRMIRPRVVRADADNIRPRRRGARQAQAARDRVADSTPPGVSPHNRTGRRMRRNYVTDQVNHLLEMYIPALYGNGILRGDRAARRISPPPAPDA